MAIESKNKIDSNFSMSSMSDIVFLLLIFFMLTSNSIIPSGLKVNLPKSAATQVESVKIGVTVTAEKSIFVGNQEVSVEEIAPTIQEKMKDGQKVTVALNIDESVSYGLSVQVAGEVMKTGAKINLLAKPK